jgi:hypothetical protein
MAEWKAPVFDRTQADVDYAKQQLAKKLNTTEYKGCFNITDINRIENNTRYLADSLLNLYYFNTLTTNSAWSRSGLPNQQNVDRIISNVNKIWAAWAKPKNALSLPTTLLTFEHVNNIEKNLYLLKEMLDNMVSSFKECGAYNCGED